MKMQLKLGYAVVCLLIMITFPSCGYHLRGHGSSLPEHIRNIWVPVFQNDSIRYGLEVKVTEEVKQEIINFGYKIVKDKSDADAELIGTVTRYDTAAERIDRGSKTESIRIYITVKITFTDLSKERILYENQSYRSPVISFDIPDDPAERNIREEEKIDEAIEEMADQLIQEIFTGF